MNRDDLCVLVLLAASLGVIVFVLPSIIRAAARHIDDGDYILDTDGRFVPNPQPPSTPALVGFVCNVCRTYTQVRVDNDCELLRMAVQQHRTCRQCADTLAALDKEMTS